MFVHVCGLRSGGRDLRGGPSTSVATVVEQPAFRWDRFQEEEEREEGKKRCFARDVQKSGAGGERSRSVSRGGGGEPASDSPRSLLFVTPAAFPSVVESVVTVPFAEPFSTKTALARRSLPSRLKTWNCHHLHVLCRISADIWSLRSARSTATCRWAPSVLSLPGIVRGAIEHALHCAFRGSCTGMAIGH